ncbi:hypothetical protein SDC9_184110 [bioreactor metagenome]|uniref:Uncharacterized protein n=1 Tax=bioreactor metagenome TaxID=1076179 RepID=A0A645HCZ8_9ZZZZ
MHGDGRLRRIDNNDCLGSVGIGNLHHRFTRMVGVFVDIFPRAHADPLARAGVDGFGIFHLHHIGYRMDDGNNRLTTAADKIDIVLIQIFLQIIRWGNLRADAGRG